MGSRGICIRSPLATIYTWNIVESGVKHHNTKTKSTFWKFASNSHGLNVETECAENLWLNKWEKKNRCVLHGVPLGLFFHISFKVFTNKYYLKKTFFEVSDCCLMPILPFFSAISWREQVNFQWDDDEVRFVLENTQSWIFIVLAHWKNSLWVDMSLHSDTLFWFWVN